MASQTSIDPPRAGMLRYLPSVRVLLCAFGIISSLLAYGMLQEKIMTKPYFNGKEEPGAEGKTFGSTLLLVLANRLFAAAAAALVLVVKADFGELRNSAPLYKYFLISISNVCATSCQYEALKWVTFPTQTLAKCAKMIPVMVWGTAIAGKKYRVVEYFVAVFVALGCTIFLVTGKIAAKRANSEDSWVGLALMLGYLTFDGFTSTFQEKLFGGYSMSIYNQMLYVNLCSSIMAGFFLATSGKMMESLNFVRVYPRFFFDMSFLSLSAVSGQFAITYTIKEFGALLYATIMTIRQFLAVFCSNLYYGHNMNFWQWFGAATVFLALFYKSYSKAHAPKSGPKLDLKEEAVPLGEAAQPVR